MQRPSPEYVAYIRSPQWRARRRAKLAEVGYKCESCGSDERLEVHHLAYTNLGRERPQELQVLCRVCHAIAHGEDWDILPADQPPLEQYATQGRIGRKRAAEDALLTVLQNVELELDSIRNYLPGLSRVEHDRIRWMRRRAARMRRDYRPT